MGGASVGDAVTAIDADDDTLTYTLDGDDANLFDIHEATGQITLGEDAGLDFEARDSYMLTVQAEDPQGASAKVTVAVAVIAVSLGSPVLDRYDANGDEAIDRNEAIAALMDYFDSLVTEEDVLEVIKFYFSS